MLNVLGPCSKFLVSPNPMGLVLDQVSLLVLFSSLLESTVLNNFRPWPLALWPDFFFGVEMPQEILFKHDPEFAAAQANVDRQLQSLLTATLEDYEAYAADKDMASKAMSDLLKQAKEQGLNVRAFRKLVAERKRDREEVLEEERILEQYRSLL